MKKLIYIGLPVLAVAGYVVYALFFSKAGNAKAGESAMGQGKNAPIPAQIFVINSTDFNNGIQAVGTLLANEEVDIVSEIAGKVVGVYFEEGKTVAKNQLLVKVEDTDLQAQLKRAEYQLKLVSERLERQKILLDKDAVSREEFDQVQTDYNILLADIELLKTKIEKTEIRVPFSGTIGFRNLSIGSYLQPNTIISHLSDQYKLKVEFSIPEKYASTALVGKKILFKTETSSKEHNAVVYAVDSKVDITTRTIVVRGMYDNTKENLKSGMFVRLTLVTESSSNVILVPTEAIVPEMDGKKVWVLSDGKAQSRTVTTGFRSNNDIEILSGLEIGDSVMVTGLMQVREGSAVKAE
ncbi:MAG: efflux RND transporter periplasmic adaptor subunit [Lentimicrobiaceae bacterium]|nr:efflux RND transporter periplasmic adaptor subunit [Lentimicrobiaceae bacterium]